MTVFNFFSIKNNIEGNKFDNEAAKTNVERIKNDISLNVATAYLQILVSEEQVNIAKSRFSKRCKILIIQRAA